MNTPQTMEKIEQKPAASTSSRKLIQKIQRHTRKRFASQDKIRIVLGGLK